MWRMLALALTMGIGIAGSANAQTKKELIAKLLQLQQPGIDNIGRALAGQTSQRVLQAAGQALPRLPADKRESVAKDIQGDVKKFYDEVEPILRKRATELAPATLSPIYEEKFSEDEIKTVIAWLESPASKKLQQVSVEIESSLAQKVVADTRGSVETKLKALEASLAKRLGIAPPPNPANAASGASGPKK
ncbi:MAG: DUF2059 domain-containing protein [Burkholderiaceae bacterium]|nr:DUF2059 domain-containing protein [Burkholderiaceae bacterium]